MSLITALRNLDVDSIAEEDVIDVLPYLTKILLSPFYTKRQELLKKLYPIKRANDVIHLMLTKNVDNFDVNTVPPISKFESSDCFDRLKITAMEYLRIQEQARNNSILKLIQSDLFDNPIYMDDVSYCLCVLLTKSTGNTVVNILDMSEALLHVKSGKHYIVRLVSNTPDRVQEVCHSLITFGERQDEAVINEVSVQRAKTIRILCQMEPSIAFTIRATTLQVCRTPSLTVMITLDQLTGPLDRYNAVLSYNPTPDKSSEQADMMDVDSRDDLSADLSETLKLLEDKYDGAIAFITGILLGADESSRVWFSQYTKSAQLKRIDQHQSSVLQEFRSQILAYMNILFKPILEDVSSSPTTSTSDQSREESPEQLNSPQAATSATTGEAPAKLSTKEMNKILIRATATLRLFCALRGIGGLKLSTEESELILSLITCRPMANLTSVNFAKTGVCTLLACSALLSSSKDERRAAEWLKWLIKESNYSDNAYSSQGRSSISELLLLIAIHFQNNQNNQIAELICSTLGMKLQIKMSISKCRSLFVQEVFTDQMVAEHAVKVPVTKSLSNHIVEFLPVHCIHQLLETRSFSKHQVPIQDWIFNQICESKKPIHNILPKLLDSYVNSVITSSSIHGPCDTNAALDEEDIARVFKTRLYEKTLDNKLRNPSSQEQSKLNESKSDKFKPAKKRFKKEKPPENAVSSDTANSDAEPETELKIVDIEAAQVLLLYYLVLYEDLRLKRNFELTAAERAKTVRYSPEFMIEVPVFYLLQLVRDNQNSFGTILPDLLRLVTSQFPQLCSIQHWLTVDHYEPVQSDINDRLTASINGSSTARTLKICFKSNILSPYVSTYSKEDITNELKRGFENIESDPMELSRTIGLVLAMSREEIWPFVNTFITGWYKIMDLNTSETHDCKKVIQLVTKLWWKFNTVFPRKLWVMTINSLKRRRNFKTPEMKQVEYSWDELTIDPLIVLRCDSRVFRCVDTLNIVLHILNAFLAASRRCLQDQINEQPGRQKEARNLEELRATLVLAQASAAVQILLEFCVPTQAEQIALNKREIGTKALMSEEQVLLDRFDESVNCICEHLHQVFIADTNLAKLVHFQTYPSELLSTTSDKIPSMHICLDFIPELLSQPDISKQVFVIELTSHLCDKYPITKSLNVAKLCFNVSYTLLQLLPSERRAQFFIPVLPALLRICNVFPILREDADVILSQINQISQAHMAATPSRLGLGASRPFEGIEKLTWREANKLMETLKSHEALYFCIQKCSLELAKLKECDRHILNHSNKQPQMPVFNNNMSMYRRLRSR